MNINIEYSAPLHDFIKLIKAELFVNQTDL